MVFNLDHWALANDYTKERVDLDFAYCHQPLALKSNRLWQWKFLDQKFVCMVEAILLAAIIFLDRNFVFCIWHIFNLTEKLGLKIKKVKNDLVKEQIRQIWANKTMAGLDKLFAKNPTWWHSTAVIFSQLMLKNNVNK